MSQNSRVEELQGCSMTGNRTLVFNFNLFLFFQVGSYYCILRLHDQNYSHKVYTLQARSYFVDFLVVVLIPLYSKEVYYFSIQNTTKACMRSCNSIQILLMCSLHCLLNVYNSMAIKLENTVAIFECLCISKLQLESKYPHSEILKKVNKKQTQCYKDI